ncbi:putative transcriptional regulator, GntR family [Catenulispora acidiphila DSM 44928]|uniref:Putative transcriptional regulator, GntR family n=1 Tax=Catenulispora acidiphila (strain DSM 44928 / JCM 14897 / NBRC 102108 / NRRL B-24433 / ID139908) TaxID=479433 RepID=C7Q2Q8_CATAD|nr:UTRA domain-containing protein [Catenulispora acidiphila]ACU71800.1 putative transcriptional regulator, GntR family [Catenulispora acidiphila DSM 44928]
MHENPDDSAAYLAARSGPDAWSAATADRGGASRILAVETVKPPQRIADALQLGAAERAVVRRRLMLIEDKPVEIANSWYPELLAHGTPLADPKKIKGGAPAVIAALGLALAYADEEVELESAPNAEEAQLLQVPPDKRVARLFRTAYTGDDTPVEVTDSLMLPAGRVLQYRIEVG